MILPVIITIRETNNHIVAILIICCAKNISIQYSDDALNSSGTLVSSSRLQCRAYHHNVTNRNAIVCSCNLVICRPLGADVFSVEGFHFKIVIRPSTDGLGFYSIPRCCSNARMLSLITMPSNKVIQTRPATRVVTIVISVTICFISVKIELEVIYNAVKVKIQNRIAFWCDGNLLILACLSQTEATIMTWHSIIGRVLITIIKCSVRSKCTIAKHTGYIILITIILECVRYILSYFTTTRIGTCNIIMTFYSIQILRPENNSISSILVRTPFSINCRGFIKRIPKSERSGLIDYFLCLRIAFIIHSVIYNLSVIPSIKCIPITSHFIIRTRFGSRPSCQYKLCCVIFSAFAVLIEDEPVSFRSLNCECYISGNSNTCAIFIIVDCCSLTVISNSFRLCFCCRMTFYICFRCISRYPSFKIMAAVNCIAHVDSISGFFRSIV